MCCLIESMIGVDGGCVDAVMMSSIIIASVLLPFA